MRKVSSKVPAIIGMVLTILSFALVISALIVSLNEPAEMHGISRSFALWAYSVIAAFGSLFFYFYDAVKAIKKAFDKKNPVFNTALGVINIIGVPLAIFVGGGLGINIIIWNLYYLLMFILEAVSIVMLAKENSGSVSGDTCRDAI